MLDNVTVVHYVNESGGSRSKRLCPVSVDIVSWSEARNISLHAIYLPWALNVLQLSRQAQDTNDWKLPDRVRRLKSTLGSKDRFFLALGTNNWTVFLVGLRSRGPWP